MKIIESLIPSEPDKAQITVEGAEPLYREIRIENTLTNKKAQGCGYTMDVDSDTINVYYGAADCSIALARASVRSQLAWLDANGGGEQCRRDDR